MSSPEQRKFGHNKRNTLTAQCRECGVRRCLMVAARKTGSRSSAGRIRAELCVFETGVVVHAHQARDGDHGRLLRRRRPPSDVMAMIAGEDASRGAYKPSPRGICHGDRAQPLPSSGVAEETDLPPKGHYLRNPNFDPRHRLLADSERPSDKLTECFSHHGRFGIKQTKRKVLWQSRNRTS